MQSWLSRHFIGMMTKQYFKVIVLVLKQVFCYYLFHPWIVFLVGRMNKMIALLILRNVCHHPNIYQGFSTNIYDMDMFTTVELFFYYWEMMSCNICTMLNVDILCTLYEVLTPGLIWRAATSPSSPGTSCSQSGASSCPCPWGECQCVRWWLCQLTAGLTAGKIYGQCVQLTSLLACH